MYVFYDFFVKQQEIKVFVRKGQEMLDGVVKFNFNFEYFIMSIYVICELQLYWKLKWDYFGKKFSLFFLYICIYSLNQFGDYVKIEYKMGLFTNFK